MPFEVIFECSGWEALTTYPSLLTKSSPARRMALQFLSPTGFRSRHHPSLVPPPRLCVEGYLRKWNTFADVAMPERSILDYVAAHVRAVSVNLRPATLHLGHFYEKGAIGEVVWEADGQLPALLRLVNALVDYAFYCGTGVKTAQGMGQTVRVNRGILPRKYGSA